jgi:hypothetical protein
MKATPLCGILCLVLTSAAPSALGQTSTNSGVQAIRREMEQLRQDYEQREIAEEAFAARVANIQADGATNTRVTSIEFAAQEARIVRLVIRRPDAGAPCIDELEVYGPDSPANLALASRGAVARASSLLPGYAIHAVPHLNDGSNSHFDIGVVRLARPRAVWACCEIGRRKRIFPLSTGLSFLRGLFMDAWTGNWSSRGA